MNAAQGAVLAVIVVALVLLVALSRTGGPKQDPAFYPYGNQVPVVGLPDQGENKQTTVRALKRDDDVQPDTLPTLPSGMTVQMIVDGDAIFHGEGGCFLCHGEEATGVPRRGSALTNAIPEVPGKGLDAWDAVDSLILNGIPGTGVHPSAEMPPRGVHSSLNTEQVRSVAAYVWAISQTRGEPWPGGHTSHSTSSVATPRTAGP